MTIYLWATGGLAGAGVLALVGIFIYLSFTDPGPEGQDWSMLGWCIMVAMGFFAIIHGIGWLVRWLM